jgi:hypothetical protein
MMHWKIYLGINVEFDAIVDHYALVYMVTKVGGDVHGRLTRLCLDLQGFTFRVIHRSGALHLDADAVSRLLRKDEIAYVNTADDLRDDFGPLTADDRDIIQREYPHSGDQDYLIKVINEFREERLRQLTEDEKHIEAERLKKIKSAGAHLADDKSKFPILRTAVQKKEKATRIPSHWTAHASPIKRILPLNIQ